MRARTAAGRACSATRAASWIEKAARAGCRGIATLPSSHQYLEVGMVAQGIEVRVVPQPGEVLVPRGNGLTQRLNGALRLAKPRINAGDVVEHQRIVGTQLLRLGALAERLVLAAVLSQRSRVQHPLPSIIRVLQQVGRHALQELAPCAGCVLLPPESLTGHPQIGVTIHEFRLQLDDALVSAVGQLEFSVREVNPAEGPVRNEVVRVELDGLAG